MSDKKGEAKLKESAKKAPKNVSLAEANRKLWAKPEAKEAKK